MLKCSGCGGDTKEKSITTKYGPTIVGECVGNCKNAKGYPLGTFPPRGNKQATPPGARPVAEPNKQDEILRCLLRIETILANPGKTHMAKDEMKPDEEIPF